VITGRSGGRRLGENGGAPKPDESTADPTVTCSSSTESGPHKSASPVAGTGDVIDAAGGAVAGAGVSGCASDGAGVGAVLTSGGTSARDTRAASSTIAPSTG
jgi:hypothetical protein